MLKKTLRGTSIAALALTSSLVLADYNWDPDGTGTADDILWDSAPLAVYNHSRNDSLWMISQVAKGCATHDVNVSVAEKYFDISNSIDEQIGQDYQPDPSTEAAAADTVAVAYNNPDACLSSYGRVEATFAIYEKTKGQMENPFASTQWQGMSQNDDPASPTRMSLTPPALTNETATR